LESGTENLVNYPGRIGTRVESAQHYKYIKRSDKASGNNK